MAERPLSTDGTLPGHPEHAAQFAVVDEAAFYIQAQATAFWAGARMLVAIGVTTYGALVFSYFYLKSLDSNGLWHPSGQQAPPLLGVVILATGVVACLLYVWATRRLRAGRGEAIDWKVAAALSTALLLLSTGLQIWELGRLRFFPGDSGYASLFVASAVVTIAMMLIGVYQFETVLARSLRLRGLLAASDLAANSPEVATFRLGVDAASLYAGFLAMALVLVYVLFYLAV